MVTLYRFYDAADNLLYVGVSIRILDRLLRHSGATDPAKRKSWYGEIARATFTHYQTREEAFGAEWQAIEAEKPLHNTINTHKRFDPNAYMREYRRRWPEKKQKQASERLPPSPDWEAIELEDEYVRERFRELGWGDPGPLHDTF